MMELQWEDDGSTREGWPKIRAELPGGWSAEAWQEQDDMGPPWEEHDGHGPVSEWTRRDKRPGERVLATDRGGPPFRFYDFAEAVRIARRDGWGCSDDVHRTNRARAACAAEEDFNRLRAWCRDEWTWVYVAVRVLDAAGEEVDRGGVGGVESDGEYWKELATEQVEELAEGLVLPACGVRS